LFIFKIKKSIDLSLPLVVIQLDSTKFNTDTVSIIDARKLKFDWIKCAELIVKSLHQMFAAKVSPSDDDTTVCL
jgi:hypothetical protein